MGAFRQNLTYALPVLRQNPAFAVTTIGALVLEIGAHTAVFPVVNAVLLKPLAYPGADRIVQFEQTYARTSTVAPNAFASWRHDTGITRLEPDQPEYNVTLKKETHS